VDHISTPIEYMFKNVGAGSNLEEMALTLVEFEKKVITFFNT
jgi:hypothetical protein